MNNIIKINKDKKNKSNYIFIGIILLLASLICFFIKANSIEYIDKDGFLHENFFLLPLGYLFLFIGIIIIIISGIKYKKCVLLKKQNIYIFIIVIFLIIVLDISQALLFQNSPIIKIRENKSSLYYIDNGLITYTYNCLGENKKTVFKWEKYSCHIKEDTFLIVDESKTIKNFACNEMLEEIYKDDEYIYYLDCEKSEYIKVYYTKDNSNENIKDALKSDRVKISDLDLYNIDYIKIEISNLDVSEEIIETKEANEEVNEEIKKEINKEIKEVNKDEIKKEVNEKEVNEKVKQINEEKNINTSLEKNNKSEEVVSSQVINEVVKEKTQEQINDDYRKELESKYSVKILYKDENINYLISGYIGTEKLYDDSEIYKYLQEIDISLSKYPSGFFKEMKDNNVSLTIYMVNKIDGNYSGMTDGRNQSNVIVTIKTGTYLFDYTLHHELMHYIDIYLTQIDNSLNLEEAMKQYNPEGFSYGTSDSTYDYNYQNASSAYFISSYGRENYLEDRAVLFSDMMTRTFKKDYYNEGTFINKKANLINNQLHKYYNCVKDNIKEHWERFL